jgi:twitching motility protein PilT
MLDKINKERRGHILTIEDPIEFIHRHQGCMVNQREVGADTQSFSRALKYAMRQDPDVILVGELRDLETIQAALTIAETGHLCMATLPHQLVRRDDQPHHRRLPGAPAAAGAGAARLHARGVVTQQLLPKARGAAARWRRDHGVHPRIRACIRDDKVHQIYSIMQAGKKHGCRRSTTPSASSTCSAR